MTGIGKPHVVVLGCNFAGLTTARLIREQAGDAVDITVIDRKDYLLFVPNLPLEVFANHDPQRSLHMPILRHLRDDKIRFVQAEVEEIDIPGQRVAYTPLERPGASSDSIRYDYLVVALGARLAYDKIEGFQEHGHAISDTYYANRLRSHLHDGGYRGGPVAIGSARFEQGRSEQMPEWLPVAEAACEGPPVEVSLTMGAWLEDHHLGGPQNITVFTPADVIAEDAGEKVVEELLGVMGGMGFNYKPSTRDIQRLTAEGIEFADGSSVEAELKIIFPNWEPHEFLKGLPVSDDVGFIVTDLHMRNQQYPNVMACGDAAALTVPKLGTLGHMQAEIVARQIAADVGKLSKEEADAERFWPEVICLGDYGRGKGFYIHSDTWYGGNKERLEVSRMAYWLKLGFKEAYYRTGGKTPGWGFGLTDRLVGAI